MLQPYLKVIGGDRAAFFFCKETLGMIPSSPQHPLIKRITSTTSVGASKGKVGKIVLVFFSPKCVILLMVFHKFRRSPPYRCIKGL